ncbi:MAG: ATPase, T2SS/T4P/T4SS family [Candidatus Micrarchaeia archaeon]
MDFCVTGASGTPVAEISGLVPKAILKIGNAYMYAFGYGLEPLSAYEAKEAGRVKALIINALSAGNDVSIGMFDKVRGMALNELSKSLERTRAEYVSYLLAHDTVGYGPISMLLEDKGSIEEIEINAPTSPIVVHRPDYGACRTNLAFSGEPQFRHAINKMAYEADKELNDDFPIIDVQVGNARVHAQIRPYAQSGGIATIRLNGSGKAGVDYLLAKKTVSAEALAYVWLAVDAKLNMIISGAPASGKTTLLSAILSLVPRHQRVAIIEEDVNELKVDFDFNNVVSLYGSKYGGVSAREQTINALRMRPDRLVVGEIRGEEAREMFAGANLGIPFVTTMHSNEGAIDILKKLSVKPMNVDAASISMLDVALYMKQIDISRRVLSGIYEYEWLSRAETESGIEINEADNVQVREMAKSGVLDIGALADSKVMRAYAEAKGITQKGAAGEFRKRVSLLKQVSTMQPDAAKEAISEYIGR